MERKKRELLERRLKEETEHRQEIVEQEVKYRQDQNKQVSRGQGQITGQGYTASKEMRVRKCLLKMILLYFFSIIAVNIFKT